MCEASKGRSGCRQGAGEGAHEEREGEREGKLARALCRRQKRRWKPMKNFFPPRPGPVLRQVSCVPPPCASKSLRNLTRPNLPYSIQRCGCPIWMTPSARRFENPSDGSDSCCSSC